jgi:hypothetical protein
MQCDEVEPAHDKRKEAVKWCWGSQETWVRRLTRKVLRLSAAPIIHVRETSCLLFSPEELRVPQQARRIETGLQRRRSAPPEVTALWPREGRPLRSDFPPFLLTLDKKFKTFWNLIQLKFPSPQPHAVIPDATTPPTPCSKEISPCSLHHVIRGTVAGGGWLRAYDLRFRIRRPDFRLEAHSHAQHYIAS